MFSVLSFNLVHYFQFLDLVYKLCLLLRCLLMLLWMMGVGFEDTSSFSRFVPRLYRWVQKIQTPYYQLNYNFPSGGLPPSGCLIGGYNCRLPVSGIIVRILCVAYFPFLLYKICVQNQCGHKIQRSQWRTWTLEHVFDYSQYIMLICFSTLIW